MKAQAKQDSSHEYKLWSSVDNVEWIISINSSKFEKYREALNNSFDDNHFNIESIADSEDLKQYGIMDLDDRKTIYTAISQLIASQKKESDKFQIGTQEKDHSTIYNKLQLQREKLMNDGYCPWISDKSYKQIVVHLTCGYIRNNYQQHHEQFPLKLNNDIYHTVQLFYGITFESFGDGEMVKIQLGTERYLTTVPNVSLSAVWKSHVEESNLIIVEEDKIPKDILEMVLTYLGHHKGVEPDPLPCPVRSIHMKQICSDPWDADWVDAFDKKTVFELITASNDLQIKCLLHLGCAKIATIIKQMDQKEINRIIEEEENYRRDHAATNNATNNTEDNENEDDEETETIIQGINNEQESNQLYAPSMNPTIMLLDELLSIFTH